MPDEVRQKIEGYLARLQAGLRGLNSDEAHEIVEELRSHILDKAAVGGEVTAAAVDGALTAIGSPEELASEYVTDSLLAGAEASRSPWRVLDGLFRWASLSVAGFLVLVTSMVGYFFGIVLMLCAALKALHPHTAGLWAIPNGGDVELSLRLGFGTPPTSGHELLGWRIVPLGLVGGGALVVLTTRFAPWCARQYRSSQRLPRR